jgi:murein DD-endopeptidase MepM/ murein hydrolase activator NlpD
VSGRRATLVLALVVGSAVVMPAREPSALGGIATGAGAAGPLAVAVASADLPPSRTYRPPTDAPVLDPFRPPPEPWLPGNRGIEYATPVGAAIGAIGPGIVAFAGPVAGRLVVTIDHPDGLRSSYVGLARIDVRRRQVVAAGEQVGVVVGPFHLGVRRGTTYLDPASLWGQPVRGGHAVLVPVPP